MCGIGGILAKGIQPVPPDALERMGRALSHRGPDDAGTYVSPNQRVGLTHRRLSIIDLSPQARQPMAGMTDTTQIVFNGEIYNYPELREELVKKGYPFRTHSDTEVILALYQAHGPELVRHLRGMFAFALWDGEKERLVLARDRLGIKPLYTVETPEYFLFASELRTILASGLVPKQLSSEGLSGYLAFGSVPFPHTMLSNCRSLPPATVLTLENGSTTSQAYWKAWTEVLPEQGTPLEQRVDQLALQLEEAVRCHLVSDVPVGVFLSGGIDSTAVLALMRQVTPGEIQSFSITFPGNPLDESLYSSLAARTYETEHVEAPITASDLAGSLDNILAAMDQPTVDGVNTYFVSRLARRCGVKVVLSGVGGDELFGGYPTFRMVPRLCRAYAFLRSFPGGTKLASMALSMLPQSPRNRALAEFFEKGGTAESGYFAVRRLYLDSERRNLLSPTRFGEIPGHFDPVEYLHKLVHNGKWLHPANAALLLEMRAYMHNQLLKDTDVMGMAHGVEVRVPLLDHLLVEYVNRIPIERKFTAQPKALLLSAVRRKIPEAIFRRPKMGFTFPFGAWMRGELRGHLDAFFKAPENSDLLNWPYALEVWKGFLSGRVHWSRPWSLFVLVKWVERNLT